MREKRGSLTVWFTDAAIDAWKAAPRTTPGGQPNYSDLAITTALTLRAVFRLALRQTEGLNGSILQLLGLNLPVPNFSTFSRRARTLELPAQTRTTGGAIHLLVDSTGLKLGGPGEWLVEKHGAKKRRSWRKLHIGFDAVSGQIVASILTDRDVDEDQPAIPRNTGRARLTWTSSASLKRPKTAPMFLRLTVAILSIMTQEVWRRLLAGAGSMRSLSSGASMPMEVSSETVTLSVSGKSSDWMITAGRGLPS